MPSSTDLQLCDALCAAIHAEFNALNPVRVHVPDWNQAKGLKSLRIEINPGSQPEEITDSEQDGHFVEWPVMVTFAQTISRATRAEVDELLDQVEQIRQLIQDQELDLDNGASVHCQTFAYVTRFDPGLLSRSNENGQDVYVGSFLSVIEFPFREVT